MAEQMICISKNLTILFPYLYFMSAGFNSAGMSCCCNICTSLLWAERFMGEININMLPLFPLCKNNLLYYDRHRCLWLQVSPGYNGDLFTTTPSIRPEQGDNDHSHNPARSHKTIAFCWMPTFANSLLTHTLLFPLCLPTLFSYLFA